MKPSTVFLVAGFLLALCCLAHSENCVDDCASENCVSSSCYQENCNNCANNCGCITVGCAQSCAVRCNQCSRSCRTTSCRKNVAVPDRIKTETKSESGRSTQENSRSDTKSDSSHVSSNNVTSVFDITSSVSNNNTIHMPLTYTFNHHSNVSVTPAGSPSISINITTGSAEEPRVVKVPIDRDTEILHQKTDEKHDKTVNIHNTITVTQQCCNITEQVPCHHDQTKTCYQSRHVCGPECQHQTQVPIAGQSTRPYVVEVPKPYPVYQRVPVLQPYPVKQPVYIPQPYAVYKQVQVPVPQPYPVVQRVTVPHPYPVEKPVVVPQPYPVERQVPVPQPFPVVQRVNVPQPYPVDRPIIIPRPYPVIQQGGSVQASPCLLNALQGVPSACSVGGIAGVAQTPSIPWTVTSGIASTGSTCNYLNQAPWIQCKVSGGASGLGVGLQVPEVSMTNTQPLDAGLGRELKCQLRKHALKCT